jgi:hypothetical protein
MRRQAVKHYEAVAVLLDHVADEELTGEIAKAVKELRKWLEERLTLRRLRDDDEAQRQASAKLYAATHTDFDDYR